MYVTTFPCHNCAKHIIASGIRRVVYIEPYVKSRADLLYGYALTESKEDDTRVQFQHFTGIAPSKFRDIFEKRMRMDKEAGRVHEYYEDRRAPRIGEGEINHIENEAFVVEEVFLGGDSVDVEKQKEAAPAVIAEPEVNKQNWRGPTTGQTGWKTDLV
jgi:hypothetical protein